MAEQQSLIDQMSVKELNGQSAHMDRHTEDKRRKWQVQRIQEPLSSLLVLPASSLLCAVLKRQAHRPTNQTGS